MHPETPVVDHLADLRPGSWWPDLDRILVDLDRVLPEQAGQVATTAGPAELVEP